MDQLIKIKALSQSFSKNPVLRKEFLDAFPSASLNEEGKRFHSSQELIDYLQGVEGIIVGLEEMNQEVIQALPKLKIISKFGVGLDNVDVEFAKAQGKQVGWFGGTNKRSVAEQTLAFMIGLFRNLFQTSYDLKKGRWIKEGGTQLSGKTVGIIGCGFIGTELLQLLQPFGCELFICDLLDKSETANQYNARQIDFSEIISISDVITLHVPLDKSTYHMLNSQVLQKMKTTAFLINTSRGAVVEQNALKQALIQKEIAGAALDVFEDEPPIDLEFLQLPNLVVTPHIGGNAKEAVEAMGRAAIHHLKTYFFGE